ncbi:hypothetical protein KSS87_011242 [Heliosperma pusillum]|nr:hypothetical protein KSS87_011242 [Heliosperma pusillum]
MRKHHPRQMMERVERRRRRETPTTVESNEEMILQFLWRIGAMIVVFQRNRSFSHISPHSQNLLSGLLAVVSVNVMLGFYIWMAMREPTDKHTPDPAFVAQAKAKSGAAHKLE